MTRLAPLWQQNSTYPANTDRTLLATLWPTSGSSGGAATVALNVMQINVAPGTAAVALTSGNYTALCRWDATETVAVPAAPPSGQSRIDLIVLQVRDAALDAGSNNDFIFQCITGTPTTGTPVAPSVPNNAYAICQFTVPGGAANLNGVTIVDRRGILNPRDTVHARVSRSTAYNSSTAGAPIPYDTVERDPLGLYSIAGQYFRCPVAGIYLVTGTLYLTPTAQFQVVSIYLRKNGVFVGGGSMQVTATSYTVQPNIAQPIFCAAGDQLTIMQNSSVVMTSTYNDPTTTWGAFDYLGTG